MKVSLDEMRKKDQEVELSNLDKVMYPEDGYTKQDIIDYYRRISAWILQHFYHRPLTMHRFPDGITGESFYQKNISSYFPDWIQTVSIDKESGGENEQILCNSFAALLYIVNQGSITNHVWLSQYPTLKKPDKVIFDLDPYDSTRKSFEIAVIAAQLLRDCMVELGLNPRVMTTGSKGLHVVSFIKPELGFDLVREGAKKIAMRVVQIKPDLFTLEIRKKDRQGRLLIDYLRNAYAQTSVVPYSLRALSGAPVATPLRWDELNKGLSAGKYNIKNISHRLSQMEDPWKDCFKNKKDFSKVIKKLKD